VVTRFAPSPTGRLHLGHALAALVAWETAQRAGGQFLLRLEDIDQTRCRPEYETALMDDLAWLGLQWPEPVRRQSRHLNASMAALERLQTLGLVYPCFCTRTEIQREVAAMVNAPHGPEGVLYPGTCRALPAAARTARLAAGSDHAWRLDVTRASALAGPLRWYDHRQNWQTATPDILGDVVLARKDIATSYHLAVVVDDAAQGVTRVTRGEDLFACTHLHRLLQHLLDLPVPTWAHHPLVCDSAGKRLAKRDAAASLHSLRANGATPDSIRNRLHDAITESLDPPDEDLPLASVCGQ
jgi:glutamyl-Q tRNA(Asp) synthetase